MTVAVNTSGSQTATISTEHSLATITTAGVYQLAVDTNNMVGGTSPDILELRAYTKNQGSGDTKRLAYIGTFQGVQMTPQLHSPPIIAPIYVEFTLTQLAGTGRAFPWAVYNM